MMKREAEKKFENTRELLDSYLKDFFQNKLDETWHTSKLSDVCIINPRKPELVYSDNQPTSFIPMESVDAEGGVVNNPKIQPFVKVKKGYTYFEENDVLFAKITPCMQNKKSAVAKDLINKFGFGTTEWHVFRCKENILPEWVLYFIRQQSFIEQAKSRFTGSVGQQRVPKDFIENYEISYPDIEIQKLLISKLKNIITEQETIMKDMTNQLNAISQLPSSILNEVFGQYKIPEAV
ncbi:MAG: Type I restriction modification DNA specificity domain protein [Candidatus Argoarchaeum ethanivorans]|uniref:Type I restriction modification DNA specificity domain protein n=1 Tax=Candidatus Argoarchaeum ethanivorans TaxID=2608793 RepID=A0A811TAW0_9EURY|nr:MAG: Type I restriction modification DNA specificity domain protein [Candidatus Argoarchaeum ethanivorans]